MSNPLPHPLLPHISPHISTAIRFDLNRNQQKSRKPYKEAGTETVKSTSNHSHSLLHTTTMTTNTTTPATLSSPSCGERMISIKVLSKNGPHDHWFDSRAAKLTQALYAVHFGPPMVTKAAIRALNIQHVLWIEDAEGMPIAATMLMRHPCMKFYRVSGLTVDAGHQQQGLGRAPMHRLMTDASLIKESAAELRMGVNTDKPSTEWLRQWYARLVCVSCTGPCLSVCH
jgi:hypothetical protein